MAQFDGRSVPGRFIAAPIVLLAHAVLFTAAAAAEDGSLVGERPNAGGPADEITVRVVLLDIDDIDDRNQRVSVDAYSEIAWQDRRLASDAGARRVRTVPVDAIWTPGLTIVNNRGQTAMLPNVASVDADGNVTLRQRLSGLLAVDLDLRTFPFDTQRLTIDIVSYRYPPDELAFSADCEFIADVSAFSAEGWQFEIFEPEFSIFRVKQAGDGTSMLSFPTTAERNSVFFVVTLALPMTLILFMAWTVHWLQPDIIPARIGMSTATVFSLIALGVSFRLSLPQIDYLTQADRFVIYSTLLVLVSLGITVLATRWVHDGRERDAQRLTKYIRSAFPLIFVLIVMLTLRT